MTSSAPGLEVSVPPSEVHAPLQGPTVVLEAVHVLSYSWLLVPSPKMMNVATPPLPTPVTIADGALIRCPPADAYVPPVARLFICTVPSVAV